MNNDLNLSMYKASQQVLFILYQKTKRDGGVPIISASEISEIAASEWLLDLSPMRVSTILGRFPNGFVKRYPGNVAKYRIMLSGVQELEQVGLKTTLEGNNLSFFADLHPEVQRVSKALFDDGHFPQAVFEAFKLVNHNVKNKAKGKVDGSLDGAGLMFAVFNSKKPVLALNALQSATEKDEQEGFMHLFAGAAIGIRNPQGHDFLSYPPQRVKEYLYFASLLLHKLDESIIL